MWHGRDDLMMPFCLAFVSLTRFSLTYSLSFLLFFYFLLLLFNSGETTLFSSLYFICICLAQYMRRIHQRITHNEETYASRKYAGQFLGNAITLASLVCCRVTTCLALWGIDLEDPKVIVGEDWSKSCKTRAPFVNYVAQCFLLFETRM